MSETTDQENPKSTAVVQYAAHKAPARYDELCKDTNINTAPQNWMRGRFANREPWVPGFGAGHKEFSRWVSVVGAAGDPSTD